MEGPPWVVPTDVLPNATNLQVKSEEIMRFQSLSRVTLEGESCRMRFLAMF